MLLFVVIVSALVALANSEQGSCPPTLPVDLRDAACGPEKPCTSPQLCCPTWQGGAMCVDPVTRRHFTNLVKKGHCPANPKGAWICADECTGDSDCPRALKCCRNRCGALACQKPDPESDITTSSSTTTTAALVEVTEEPFHENRIDNVEHAAPQPDPDTNDAPPTRQPTYSVTRIPAYNPSNPDPWGPIFSGNSISLPATTMPTIDRSPASESVDPITPPVPVYNPSRTYPWGSIFSGNRSSTAPTFVREPASQPVGHNSLPEPVHNSSEFNPWGSTPSDNAMPLPGGTTPSSGEIPTPTPINSGSSPVPVYNPSGSNRWGSMIPPNPLYLPRRTTDSPVGTGPNRVINDSYAMESSNPWGAIFVPSTRSTGPSSHRTTYEEPSELNPIETTSPRVPVHNTSGSYSWSSIFRESPTNLHSGSAPLGPEFNPAVTNSFLPSRSYNSWGPVFPENAPYVPLPAGPYSNYGGSGSYLPSGSSNPWGPIFSESPYSPDGSASHTDGRRFYSHGPVTYVVLPPGSYMPAPGSYPGFHPAPSFPVGPVFPGFPVVDRSSDTSVVQPGNNNRISWPDNNNEHY